MAVQSFPERRLSRNSWSRVGLDHAHSLARKISCALRHRVGVWSFSSHGPACFSIERTPLRRIADTRTACTGSDRWSDVEPRNRNSYVVLRASGGEPLLGIVGGALAPDSVCPTGLLVLLARIRRFVDTMATHGLVLATSRALGRSG
jgi:hypothetical protein